jgi:hypothetical protein
MKKLLKFLRELYTSEANAPEAQLHQLSLVVNIRQPQSRVEKRLAVNEYKKVTDTIKPLEDEYLNDLFSDNDNNDLYTHYLNAFTFKSKRLNQTLRFIKINEYYFSELYHK